MLIDVDTGRSIDLIPYRAQFDHLKARLSRDEFEAMLARINELIDESGAEIATAGLAPRQRLVGNAVRADLHEGCARRFRSISHVLWTAGLVHDHEAPGTLGIWPLRARQQADPQPNLLPTA